MHVKSTLIRRIRTIHLMDPTKISKPKKNPNRPFVERPMFRRHFSPMCPTLFGPTNMGLSRTEFGVLFSGRIKMVWGAFSNPSRSPHLQL